MTMLFLRVQNTGLGFLRFFTFAFCLPFNFSLWLRSFAKLVHTIGAGVVHFLRAPGTECALVTADVSIRAMFQPTRAFFAFCFQFQRHVTTHQTD
jgi:hypothetical protein